uniref:Uncharacterized protein n=1 Tax=Steinernema glaseri TaxID=37863 RepID=A0A1I7YX07_9BILA
MERYARLRGDRTVKLTIQDVAKGRDGRIDNGMDAMRCLLNLNAPSAQNNPILLSPLPLCREAAAKNAISVVLCSAMRWTEGLSAFVAQELNL